MHRASRINVFTCICITLIMFTSCGKSGPTKPTPTVPPPPQPTPPPVAPVPTRITITPSIVRLTEPGQTIQLQATVIDQNGSAITGAGVTWSSANTGVASVSTQGLVTAVMNGVTQITARSGSVSGRVSVTVMAPLPNRPPEPVGEIEPLMLTEGGPTVEVDVSGAFRDPDGDELKFAAESNDEQVATVTASEAMVTIVPVRAGSATITVTATDPAGLSATQETAVTVEERENRSPEPVGEIEPLMLTEGGPTVEVDVSGAFRDPDGDELKFAAESNDEQVATAEVDGAKLTVRPVAAGEAMVTVTASDGSLTAEQRFIVTVRQIVSQGADLVVESPTVNASDLGVSEQFFLTVTVRNQGDSDAPSTLLRYYLSSDATISSDDTEVDTTSIDPLGAYETSGETLILLVTLTAPTVPGQYFYGVCIDPVAGESNTQNNCSGAVSVTVDGPDYVVESLTASKDDLSVGELFDLFVTVRNQSDYDAVSRTTLVHAYLSTDTTISSDDMEIGASNVYRLDASETSEQRFFVTASEIPGTYYYGACIDPVAEESNSQNNCSGTVTVTVNGPDYIVESLTASKERLNVGERFQLNATVRNQSDYDAVSGTTLRAYLSTDTTISSDDMEIGEGYVRRLDASETSDVSIRLEAPEEPGTFFYGVCVVPGTGDSDKRNNCSIAVTVTVSGPDYVVASISTSDDQLDSGGRLTLNAIVLNQGDGDATSTTTLHYYRSSDATISTDDTEVGEDIVFILDASETSEESIRLEAPEEPGIYYYGACVDPVVGESDTKNNCSDAVSVTVDGPENRPPEPVGEIEPLMLVGGGPPVEVDVAGAFRDPDSDEMKYTAFSSDDLVATVEAVEAEIIIAPVSPGKATVTVRATDPDGLSATQNFIVTTMESSPNRETLIELYDRLGGQDWSNRTNWLTNAPLDRWHGVTTDADGQVTQLQLSSNNLRGPLPGELLQLIDLTILNLHDNNLTGSIPADLGQLASLEVLALARNQLTGIIPSGIEHLGNLEVLYLAGNQLSGDIPAEIEHLNSLEILDLRENQLSGPIPPEIGQLNELIFLELSVNQLMGVLPSEIGRLELLTTLNVASNAELSGPLPLTLTSLNLESLQVNGTQLCVPLDEEFREWLSRISDLSDLEGCPDQ